MGSLGHGRGRIGRGLTLSAACLALPAIAHAAAGGGAPAAGPFLFATGLLSAACVALADRRIGAGRIAVLVFASQPAFHALLNLSAHGHGSAATPSVGMVVGHAAAAGVLTVLLAGGEAVLWSMAALSAVLFGRCVWIPAFSVTAPRLAPLSLLGDDAASRFVLLVSRTAPRRGPPLPAHL